MSGVEKDNQVRLFEFTASERVVLFVLMILLGGSAIYRIGRHYHKEELAITHGISEENKIDINSADALELQLLSNIGPVLSKRIVKHRAVNGSFSSISKLKDISGINGTLLDVIRPLIYASQKEDTNE